MTRTVPFLMTLTLAALSQPAHAQIQSQLPPTLPYPGQPIPASIPDPLSGNVPQQIPANPVITPGQSLGLEQEAWKNPRKHMSSRQSRPGFLRVNWRPDDIIQVNAREGLLSVIKFPRQEEIVLPIVSDPKSFEIAVAPNRRSLSVRGIYPGVDGNLIVYGASNNVYTFYLRSLPYNANVLPDTTVEIIVGGMAASTGETLSSTAPVSAPYADYDALYKPAVATATENFDHGSREFARIAGTDPSKMRNNITIREGTPGSRVIAPVRAWQDGKFTYLDFGPTASSMTQWPVASLVVQDVESPVGTRAVGPDRSLMIVEAVGNITLRNGNHLICLTLDVHGNDTRNATAQPLKDTRPVRIVERRVPVHVPVPAAAPLQSPPPGARSAPPPHAQEKRPAASGAPVNIAAPAPVALTPVTVTPPAKTPVTSTARHAAGSPSAKPVQVDRTTPTPAPGAPLDHRSGQQPATVSVRLGPYNSAQANTVKELIADDLAMIGAAMKPTFKGSAGYLIIGGLTHQAASTVCDLRKQVGDSCTITPEQ